MHSINFLTAEVGFPQCLSQPELKTLFSNIEIRVKMLASFAPKELIPVLVGIAQKEVMLSCHANLFRQHLSNQIWGCHHEHWFKSSHHAKKGLWDLIGFVNKTIQHNIVWYSENLKSLYSFFFLSTFENISIRFRKTGIWTKYIVLVWWRCQISSAK